MGYLLLFQLIFKLTLADITLFVHEGL